MLIFTFPRPRRFRFVALLISAGLATNAYAGKLSEARSEVRGDSTRNDTSEDGDRHSSGGGLLSSARDEVRSSELRHRKHHHRYRGSSYVVAPILIYEADDGEPSAMPQPLTGPFPVDPPPPSVTTDPELRPLCKYPYCAGWQGYHIDRPWGARLILEHGFRTEGVQREGFGLLFESEGALGAEFDWNQYSERLPFGRNDRLEFGDVNVFLRVFDEPSARVRIGAGINWLHDRYGTDAGLNLTAAADFFPVRPVVVSGRVDLGSIGETSTFHARMSAGVVWKRLEFFGGYDYRSIGSVSLHGPLLGFRIWF